MGSDVLHDMRHEWRIGLQANIENKSEIIIHHVRKRASNTFNISNSVTHGTKVGSAVVGLYEGSVVGVNVGNKVGSDVGIN